MKKQYTKKSILLIFIFFTSSYSQSGSPKSLFPLQVGNIWQYKVSHYTGGGIPPIISYGKVEVLRDTLIEGNKYFQVWDDNRTWPIYYYNEDYSRNYFRYDSTQKSVIIYNDIHGEGLFFRLNAIQDDCWKYFYLDFCCYIVDTVLFFGEERLRKYFADLGGPPWQRFKVAKGLGPIETWDDHSWSVTTYKKCDLVYAKIDGVEYGTYVTNVSDEPEKPNEYLLLQNYPNPFNPTTKIKYQIPKTGFLSLKVYDLLGREVTILVNEEKPAGGYEVEFDGNGLSSGIYFYKIEAGDYSSVKKMLLLK